MYKSDLDAVYQRAESLERELKDVKTQKHADAARVAQLEQSLLAAQQTIARMRTGHMAAPPMDPHLMPSQATTVLVLGILSVTICSLMGPIAWHYGNDELRRIDAGQANPLKRGEVVAGRILGIIATALMIVAMLMVLFVFAVA